MKAFLPDILGEDNEKIPVDYEISPVRRPGDGKIEKLTAESAEKKIRKEFMKFSSRRLHRSSGERTGQESFSARRRMAVPESVEWCVPEIGYIILDCFQEPGASPLGLPK
jgi:hypothetical protein